MGISSVIKNWYYDLRKDHHYRESVKRLHRAEYRLPDIHTRFALPWLFEGKGHFRHLTAYQHPQELLALYRLVSELEPSNVLEIGTARGGTLYLWAQAAKTDARIASVDLPGGPFGGGYRSCRIPFYHMFGRDQQQIELIRSDSHASETVDRVKEFFSGESIDFLFVDADHSLRGICGNLERYAPMVAEGGLIALHDVLKNPRHPDIEIWRLWDRLRGLPGVSTLDQSLNVERVLGIGLIDVSPGVIDSVLNCVEDVR